MKKILSFVLLSSLSLGAFANEAVLKRAAKDYGINCDGTDLEGRVEGADRVTSAVITNGDSKVTYHLVMCSMAAYNDSSVVYVESSDGTLSPVHLSVPKVGPRYGLKGFMSTPDAMGAGIDAKKKTLTTFYKGRGIGDAFESGTYSLEDGTAVLKKFVMDNTFDGNMNPKTIVNYK